MKLTYTCSLVSRGFKLVDQAVGYDMQDAARRFLMDGMGALAAQRFDIGIVDDLQCIPEAHSLDPFILSGGGGTQQTWTLTVAQQGETGTVNVLVRFNDDRQVLVESDSPINLFFLQDGDSNWDTEENPDTDISVGGLNFYVQRIVCKPTDVTELLAAFSHVPPND
ncbi:hypothetical protein [Pseudomonas oryzihabitans]|uniref:Uncharacterized protein n=1 Tax=Pseudomonas oryzihabitans TaxID=47885 RepID=A0ABX3IS25_9PSED|nr:hypothetical protein [Pseudomonas psychrotolerans]ONN71123.1 hypothetical protein BVL52_11525 [Pseudomonas psychrotolerans]